MTRTTTVLAALLLLGGTGCAGVHKVTEKEREAAANAARAQEATAKATTLEARLAEAEARAKAAEEKAAAAEAKARESAEWAAGSEAKAQALLAQLDRAKRDLAAVTEARDALQAQTAALAEEKGAAEKKTAEYESLAGSLQQQIQAGQVELSQLKDKMTVKLKDRILFASGSARLNPEGRKALDAVAVAFKNLDGKNVLVAGYTDDVRVSKGLPYKDNWDLSSARAIAVVRYLVARGVPPEMLAAAGYSQFRPLAPNDSAANRSMNRRIEIALTAAEEAPVVEAPQH